MTYKKTWLGYLLWAVYTAMATVFHVGMVYVLLQSTPISNVNVQVAITCGTFVLAAGIYALARSLFVNTNEHAAKKDEEDRKKALIWEIQFVFIVLAIGIYCRLAMAHGGTQEAAYYEIAKVTGAAVPNLAQGAEYFYVLLLRGVFWMFGNHFRAAILTQMILQLAAALVWYLAVRKLAGRVAAAICLMGTLLLPQGITAGITLSPKMLYALLYGIGLLMLGRVLHRQKTGIGMKWYSWVHTVLTGVVIGLLIYLDVMGLTLFLLLPVVFFVKREKEETGRKKVFPMVLQVIIILFTALSTTFVSMIIDGAWCGASCIKVLETWLTLYRMKGPGVVPSMLIPETIAQKWLMILVSAMILLGIPAFFARKKAEVQIPVFVLFLGVAGIQAGSFMAQSKDCEYMLYVLVLAMAGVAVQAMLCKKEEAAIAAETVAESEAVTTQQADGVLGGKSDKMKPDKEEVEGMAKEKEAVNDTTETKSTEKKIKFIENPLPLPKKHVKKVMDYQKKLEYDEMEFDYEVADDDDFDID